jgi:hypothetical protein
VAGASFSDLVGPLTLATALIASVSYVLLNSAYLEFYSSLGVRPEEVGLDRLALLGRTSGLLIGTIGVAFSLVLGALAIYAYFRSRLRGVPIGTWGLPADLSGLVGGRQAVCRQV